jgi:uncharacterized protein (TIGR04255 family)
VAYKKPTLIETAAELYLEAGTLTESSFFELVPELKKLGFDDVEFVPVGMALDVQQGRPSSREIRRVFCWKPGRTQLVQVGEDLVVVNLTGDYPGWDAFVKLFSEARHALSTGLGSFRPSSLNLVAVDGFEVRKDHRSISDYLKVGGEILPTWYAHTKESLDLTMGRGLLDVDGHNRQVHVTVRAATDPIKIGFRTQLHDKVEGGSNLDAVLSRLHDESNITFECLITDYMRQEIMGGRRA